MIVKVTQFLRPDGRQIENSCEVRDDLLPKYEAIKAAGCRLTVELLQTGVVSQAIEHREGDFDMVLSKNGPGENSPNARLEEMIERFDRSEFDVWLKALEE